MRDELLQIVSNLMQQQQMIIDNLDDFSDDELFTFQQDFQNTLQQVNQALDILEAQEQAQTTTETQFIPEEADMLWILAGGNEEAFASYIDTYPSNNLDRYKGNPQAIRMLSEQLKNRLPQDRKGEQDGVPQAWLQSSNIYGFQYDPRSKKLKVKFQGDGVYEYEGVPQSIYQMFANGAHAAVTSGSNAFGSWYIGKKPSLGSAFYHLIKLGGYPYEKIS